MWSFAVLIEQRNKSLADSKIESVTLLLLMYADQQHNKTVVVTTSQSHTLTYIKYWIARGCGILTFFVYGSTKYESFVISCLESCWPIVLQTR